MLSKFKIYETFIFTLILSSFLTYFTSSGVLSYFPIIIILPILLVVELYQPTPMNLKYWLAILVWLPYTIWAVYIFILNPFQSNYFSPYLLSFVSFPFIVLALSQIKQRYSEKEFYGYLYNLIFFFCIAELIICFGQLSTYSFGIGLPVNYSDQYMITGTYANSNDLSSVLLIISFIVISIENATTKNCSRIWWLILVLLLLTNSRTAMLIITLLFITSRRLNIKNIFLLLISLGSIYTFIYYILLNIDSGPLGRINRRMESMIKIANEGSMSDQSISLRLESYIYFFKQIPNLGLGTGEINNYFKYSQDANFDTGLMFINPHSLIVEIGYWLGVPGLLAFIVAFLYMLFNAKRKIILFIVLISSSLIPATVLPNISYFLFFLISFYNHRSKQKKPLEQRI